MPLTKTELKDIQSLLTKKGRKLKKQFVAEGVRLLEEAVRHRFRPLTVYYAEALLSERAQHLLNTFRAQHVETFAVPSKQLEGLSDTETPQGVVAVFSVPSSRLGELYRPKFRKVLLCENINDPGNLGTLIRSALAFDFELVILSGSSAEPYGPKVVRSSVGAVFGVPIAEAETAEILAVANRHEVAVVAADTAGVDGPRALKELRQRPVVLAIGSESHGLTAEIVAAASVRLRIAHSEMVESLNAAVAGSILMKEIYELSR